MEDHVEKGCRVSTQVNGVSREGVVRFVGSTRFANGQWVGIELPGPDGKNDGSVQDRKYFECPPLHGVFCRLDKCTVLSRAPPPETPRDRRAREEGRPQDIRDASPQLDETSTSPAEAPLSSLHASFSRLSAEASPVKEMDDLDTSSEETHEESTQEEKEKEKEKEKVSPKATVAAAAAASPPKSAASAAKVLRPPTAGARVPARVPAKRVPAPRPSVSTASSDRSKSPESASPSPKVALPALTLSGVTAEGAGAGAGSLSPPLRPAGGAGGLLGSSSNSLALATPRTPRQQVSEDVRLLNEQKKSLELKLKQKTSQLAELQEQLHTERDTMRAELKQKYETQKKSDAENIKRIDNELKEKEERVMLLELELEIAVEEKTLAEANMSKMQSAALDVRLMEEVDPDCNDSLLEHCAKLVEAIETMNVMVATITQERDMLKEEMNELRKYKERCSVLSKKVAVFEERLDEYADLEEDLEAQCEEVARLRDEKLQHVEEILDLKELSELSSALEHAAGLELEKMRTENDTLHLENADYETRLGEAKREAVAREIAMDKYKSLVAEYQESLREYDDELKTQKLKEQIGEEKQRQALTTEDVAKEFKKLVRDWADKEQSSRHEIAESYKDNVLDFLPTVLVELETPLLDAMASLERALFYAQHIESASGELLLLQLKSNPEGDEAGYVQVSPGLFKDAAFEEYDLSRAAELTSLHMWLVCFVLSRLQVLACSRAELLLIPEVAASLRHLDEEFRCFLSRLEKDAVSPTYLSQIFPKIFEHVACLWRCCREEANPASGGETTDDETDLAEKERVSSGTLLFFLLGVLSSANLFQGSLACVERYCTMYNSELSDENRDLIASLTADMREHRSSLVHNVKSMFDDLEQVEVKVSLDADNFQKLQIVLMTFIHASMEMRRLCVLLHDRASDAKHGTTSKVDGFFGPHILSAISNTLQGEKVLSLADFLDAPTPEDPRLVYHDLRKHLTAPLLVPDLENLSEFCVLDNNAPLVSMLQDASSVTFKVWSDLQKLYWDESGPKKDPNAVEGEGKKQAANSPHLLRALETRKSLASVGDLLQKIQTNDATIKSEQKRRARVEKELAESLVEIDNLVTIADNVREHGAEREHLRKEYEEKIATVKEEQKKQVQLYREACNELKADLETERNYTQSLSTAVNKRKSAIESSGGDAGEEVLRLRQALLFSQKQLKQERHAAWKGRWRRACAASGVAVDREGEESLPASPSSASKAAPPLSRILQDVSEISASLTPEVLMLPSVDLTAKPSGLPSFVSAKAQLKAQQNLSRRVDSLFSSVAVHRRLQQEKDQQKHCRSDLDPVLTSR